jgi:hypothetical protein
MEMKIMRSVLERARSSRDFPLEALQTMAELGVGLDDIAVMTRVAEGLQEGVPKCCIVFGALFYGRAVDAGRHDLVAGYRTWMNNSRVGPLSYIPCPHCVLEGDFVDATASTGSTQSHR